MKISLDKLKKDVKIKTQDMITLQIKHSDGDREINLSAETMKELIEKLSSNLPKLAEDLPLLKQLSRFKKDPKGEEKKERESGWYYDC